MQQISDEELAKMQQQFKMEDGTKRVLDKLVARRKLKKQYEYEVQWKGFDPTQNTWMPRDKCAPPPGPLFIESSPDRNVVHPPPLRRMLVLQVRRLAVRCA